MVLFFVVDRMMKKILAKFLYMYRQNTKVLYPFTGYLALAVFGCIIGNMIGNALSGTPEIVYQYSDSIQRLYFFTTSIISICFVAIGSTCFALSASVHHYENKHGEISLGQWPKK